MTAMLVQRGLRPSSAAAVVYYMSDGLEIEFYYNYGIYSNSILLFDVKYLLIRKYEMPELCTYARTKIPAYFERHRSKHCKIPKAIHPFNFITRSCIRGSFTIARFFVA